MRPRRRPLLTAAAIVAAVGICAGSTTALGGRGAAGGQSAGASQPARLLEVRATVATAPAPTPTAEPTAAISQPARAGGAASGSVVLDVPLFAQIENLDCEAASLQMALAFSGIRESQPALLAAMRPDFSRPELTQGIVTSWTDPYVNFVGDPSGHEYDHTGYGVYFPVVARVAAEVGAHVLWSGTGLAWAALRSLVVNGHPVVVWIAYDGSTYGAAGPLYRYRATDGREVLYAPGYEHTVVVAGVDGSRVLLDNPRWGWRSWVPEDLFLEAIAPFGGMGVALG